jgi:hypothetical protein
VPKASGCASMIRADYIDHGRSSCAIIMTTGRKLHCERETGGGHHLKENDRLTNSRRQNPQRISDTRYRPWVTTCFKNEKNDVHADLRRSKTPTMRSIRVRDHGVRTKGLCTARRPCDTWRSKMAHNHDRTRKLLRCFSGHRHRGSRRLTQHFST